MTATSVSIAVFVLNLLLVIFLLVRYQRTADFRSDSDDAREARDDALAARREARESHREADYWRRRAQKLDEPTG